MATQAEAPTPTPTTAGNRKVELVKQGFTETVTSTPAGDFASFNCGIIVHNLDQTEAAVQVDWTVNFYDAGGAKVAGSYGYERNLFPDETRGVGDGCGGQTQPQNVKITRMETLFHVCDTCWVPVITKKRITATVANLDKSGSSVYKATGSVANPLPVAIDNVHVLILSYNAAGDIIASNGALVASVPAGGSANFESQVYVAGYDNSGIDHVAAFVQPQTLKLIDLRSVP